MYQPNNGRRLHYATKSEAARLGFRHGSRARQEVRAPLGREHAERAQAQEQDRIRHLPRGMQRAGENPSDQVRRARRTDRRPALRSPLPAVARTQVRRQRERHAEKLPACLEELLRAAMGRRAHRPGEAARRAGMARRLGLRQRVQLDDSDAPHARLRGEPGTNPVKPVQARIRDAAENAAPLERRVHA